ncbi:tyrosine-type recombinase/integrase [Escherichia coli]|nr:tyrosine-type recombinase/integrase [Escherichia coli]HCP8002309.1 tyrosine-type recombinase/integrase [Escherichia coli]
MKNKADNKKRNFLTHSEIESLLKAANTGPHAARTSYPHAESEWVFLSRKGNPLSRQQFYHIISTSGGNAGLSLEIHPHMLRHSCGFALANMGIDTRLIQDYLGHRNIRHTVWYTASNAGRFYGIWDRARGRQRHAVL